MYKIEYYNLDSHAQLQDQEHLSASIQKIVSNIDSDNSPLRIFQKQNPDRPLTLLEKVARRIRDNFSSVIIIGMGGASLNPATILGLVGQVPDSPQIYFLDNTDPIFLAQLLSNVDIHSTAVIAISNSGETLETNSLVGCLLRHYQNNNIADLHSRVVIVANHGHNMLKNIATEIDCTFIPHQSGISGRYSGLSTSTLLVGLIAGVDIYDYLRGANLVIDDFRNNQAKSAPAIGASAIHSANLSILVNLGYLQKFSSFLEWYSQIIAESLGKDGLGYTPLRGLGPNDQHSMLQLYLDGPRDKLFSLFYIDRTLPLPKFETSDIQSLGYLQNKNLAEINRANFQATLNALVSKEMPVRSIILDDISAMSCGTIVCHLMFEVILLGYLLSVHPFDQPGVELIKQKAKKIANI